jgi:hypothetical protein
VNAIPDPAQFVYQPARRRNVGTLIMLAGASGTGKTLSALRLAKGLAGPDGVIAFADTENGRALYYASAFTFNHLSLEEPFRPSKFEAAAIAAQRQKAAVWICDSFSHEHVGPGGLLDFHEDELTRMVQRQQAQAEKYNRPFDEFEARDRMKAAAWIKPKGEHKHMLQRFWQLNAGHIILCCQAERKLLLQKITEGNRKGKTDWVDAGFQPVCGPDIPYAMTMSFMLEVKNPGVPIVIKPLLDDLKPLVPLDKPIDEALGERIAAWARGDAVSVSAPSKEGAKTEAPSPPPAEPSPESPPPKTKREVPEAEIVAGADKLYDAFLATRDRREHLAIVDNADNRKQLAWLKKNRPDLHMRVDAALRGSWARTEPEQPAKEQSGMDL